MPGRVTAPGFLLRGRLLQRRSSAEGPVWPNEPKLPERNTERRGTAIQVTVRLHRPDDVLYCSCI
jgi:hypothetical protein